MQTRRGFLGLLTGAVAAAAVLPEAKVGSVLDSDTSDFNENFARAQEKRSAPRRLAYMRISNTLLDKLIPEGMTLALPDYIGEKEFAWLEKALLLPPEIKIVDVSRHVFFTTDETAIKLEGLAFEEHVEGNALRQVTPTYYRMNDGVVRILSWSL